MTQRQLYQHIISVNLFNINKKRKPKKDAKKIQKKRT